MPASPSGHGSAYASRSDGRFDLNFQWRSGLSAGWDQFFDSVAIQRVASSSVAKLPTWETGPYPVLTATVQRPSLIIFEWNFGFSLIARIRAGSRRVPNETIRQCWRSRFLAARQTPETAVMQADVDLNEEVAMNAIVAGVLSREAAKTQAIPHPLTFIALFCGVGLVASLAMASMGFDLGAAFF